MLRTQRARTPKELLHGLTARQIRQELAQRRAGSTSDTSRAWMQGWLACAMTAGAITLAEKGAAELAVAGDTVPEHLGEWWTY